jgi:hypothetical protein
MLKADETRRRLMIMSALSPQTRLEPKIKGVRLPAPVPLEQREAALLKRLETRAASGGDVVSVQLQLVSLYQIWSGSGVFVTPFNNGHALVKELMEKHRQGPAGPRVVAVAADWYRHHGFYERVDPLYREMLAAQRAKVAAAPTRTAYLELATTLMAHSEALEVRPRCAPLQACAVHLQLFARMDTHAMACAGAKTHASARAARVRCSRRTTQ